MALTQAHYRFGINELLETTHGWHAAEDTNPVGGTIAVDTTFLLRFTLQADGSGTNNVDAEFQYRKNGGAWTQITTGTANVKAVTPVCWANAANTTKRLSGSGTFIGATGCTADGISGGTSLDIAASGNAETECALQLVGANLAVGDFIEFRLTRDGGTLIDTYAVTPGISLAADLSTSVASETRRILDFAAGVAIGASILASGLGLGEVVKASDAVQAALNPPPYLSVQVATESVRSLERIYGAAQFVASVADRTAGLIETPPVKASTVGFVDLLDSIEPLTVADGPPSAALVAGAVDPTTSASESLKVADVVLGPTLDPEQASPSDALKVSDTATPSLNPEQATPAEALKVVDVVLGPTLTPEQAAPGADALKVVDTVLGPTLNPEQAIPAAESLKVSDSVRRSMVPSTTRVGDNTADTVNGTEDTQISSLFPTTNEGSGTDLEATKFDAGTHVNSLIRFTGLSTFSPGSPVENAVLNLYLDSLDGAGTQTITARRCLRAWTEGGATHNTYDGSTPWGTAGANAATDRSATVSATATIGAVGAYYPFTGAQLIADVQAIIDQSQANEGWVLERTDGADDATWRVFASSEAADGKRPYLTVTLGTSTGANPSESLKVVDAVVVLLSPEQATPSESLKVVDAVLGPTLNPEQATLSEALKVTDTVLTLLNPEQATPSEALSVVDSVAPSLNPEQATPTESLKVVDVVLGPTLDPEQASPTDLLKVVDSVSTTLNPLQTTGAEALKVVDLLAADISLTTSGQESLKVVDTVFGPILDPEQTTLSDALKVVDAVLGPTIDPEQVTAAEALKVADSVTSVLQLAISVDEPLKVADVTTLLLNPEQVAPTDTLKVVDVVLADIGGNLLTAADEVLKVVDLVTPSLNPEQATPTDSLKVVDLALTTLNPEQAASVDALKVADSLSVALQLATALSDSLRVTEAILVTLNPEQAVPSEALKVVDSLTVALQWAMAVPADALKVVDTVLTTLDPEQVSQPESLKVADSVTVALNLSAVLTDALKVVDVSSVSITPEFASLTDALKVADVLLAEVVTNLGRSAQDSLSVVDAPVLILNPEQTAAAESLRVADVATVSLNLSVVAAEACHVTDGLFATLNPLQATLSESISIGETVGGATGVHLANLPDEHIHVVDQLAVRMVGQPPREWVVVPAQDRWFVVEAQDRWFVVPVPDRWIDV